MTYLILSLIVLGAVAAMAELVSQHRHGETPVVKAAADCASCTDPQTAKCEQVCMMEAATKPVEYYDDEELDAFRGRPSDAYNDDETAQFADVLETLRPDEVKPWARSLTLRGISMPDGLKDEFAILAQQ